jgi:cobalt-zinc-cadmium efflux system protein
MSEESFDLATAEKRRTLWIVLLLNLGLAVGFGVTGIAADSSALIANGLDNASDGLVYIISLLALSRSQAWKRGAALTSGVLLLLFAAGVLFDAGRRGARERGLFVAAEAVARARREYASGHDLQPQRLRI